MGRHYQPIWVNTNVLFEIVLEKIVIKNYLIETRQPPSTRNVEGYDYFFIYTNKLKGR